MTIKRELEIVRAFDFCSIAHKEGPRGWVMQILLHQGFLFEKARRQNEDRNTVAITTDTYIMLFYAYIVLQSNNDVPPLLFLHLVFLLREATKTFKATISSSFTFSMSCRARSSTTLRCITDKTEEDDLRLT